MSYVFLWVTKNKRILIQAFHSIHQGTIFPCGSLVPLFSSKGDKTVNDIIDFEVMADLMTDYFEADHQDRQKDQE